MAAGGHFDIRAPFNFTGERSKNLIFGRIAIEIFVIFQTFVAKLKRGPKGPMKYIFGLIPCSLNDHQRNFYKGNYTIITVWAQQT